MRSSYALFLVSIAGLGVFVSGCAGTKTVKGPSDQELVAQVMQSWKTAWEGKNVDQIMACVSQNYVSSSGDGRDSLQKFAEKICQNDKVRIQLLLDDMEVAIQEGTARVTGIRSKISSPKQEGLFGLTSTLRKENGAWLITWIDAWDLG